MKLSPNVRRTRRGIALVVVLAAVVIVTVLVVAFTTLMQLDREATRNYAEAVRAAELARGGGAWVANEIAAEIAAGSMPVTNAPGKVIYEPLPGGQVQGLATYATMRPARLVTPAEATALPNLTRRSLRPSIQQGLASGFWSTNAIGWTLPASAVSTDTPSLNGRRLLFSTWNRPLLMSSSQTNAFRVPDWIYVDRRGPVASLADQTQGHAELSNPQAPAAVIGRFAFVIYETGGLLDVNVAGNSLDPAENAHRGHLHQADLTAIPGWDAAAVAALVDWRSPASGGLTAQRLAAGDPAEPGSYDLFDPENDFSGLNPTDFNGDYDQRLVGRQDLLAFARSAGVPDSSLEFLTTFSRSSDRALFLPENPNAIRRLPANNLFSLPGGNLIQGVDYEREANADRATALAGNDTQGQPVQPFPNRNTLRASWTGNFSVTDWEGNNVNVEAGDPVLPRRFPLAKLDLFRQYREATGSERTAIANEILHSFGLVPDPAFAGASHRWVYVRARSIGNPSYPYNNDRVAILTLDQMEDTTVRVSSGAASFATSNHQRRFPNFFEILNAGLLRGETGLWGLSGGFPQTADSRTRFEQILRIGVNIIDAYDEDGLPTHIRLKHDGAASRDFLFTGTESVPFISESMLFPERSGTSLTAWEGFEIWNPHRPESGSLPPLTPTEWRIVATAGRSTIGYGNSMSPQTPPPDPSDNPYYKHILGGGSVYYYAECVTQRHDFGAAFASNPENTAHQVRFTYSAGAFDTPELLGTANASGGEVIGTSSLRGIALGSYDYSLRTDEAAFPINPVTDPPDIREALSSVRRWEEANSNLDFELQYRADGVWHTYQTYRVVGRSNPYSDVIVNPAPGDQFAESYTGITTNRPLRSGGAYATLPNTGWSDTSGSYWQSQPFSRPGFPINSAQALDPRTSKVLPGTSASDRLGYRDLISYNEQSYGTRATPGLTFTPEPVTSDRRVWWRNAFQVSGPTAVIFSSQTDPGDLIAQRSRVAAYGTAGGGEAYRLVGALATNPNSATPDGPRLFGRDGVWRPTDLTFLGNTDNPLLTANLASSAARPVVRNAPFRSVGDLATVYRALPWRSLNLTHPASSEAGLLGLFTINDTPGPRAGVVDINAARPEVLTALLAGAEESPGEPGTRLTVAEAATLADRIVAGLGTFGPLRQRADLAWRLGEALEGVTGLPTRKHEREAFLRSIVGPGDVGTWNLLIDVVAQTGRFPRTSGTVDLARFKVEGQQRLWIHLALDRFSGKIVARQLETVRD